MTQPFRYNRYLVVIILLFVSIGFLPLTAHAFSPRSLVASVWMSIRCSFESIIGISSQGCISNAQSSEENDTNYDYSSSSDIDIPSQAVSTSDTGNEEEKEESGYTQQRSEGITLDYLNQRLYELRSSLGSGSPSVYSSDHSAIYDRISRQANALAESSGRTVSSAASSITTSGTLTNPTITGANITGSAFSGTTGTFSGNISSGGNLGIGETSSLHAIGAQLKLAGTAGSEVSILTSHDSYLNSRSGVSFIRTRGTVAVPTAVALDDRLGFLGFKGYDGTNTVLAGLVEAYVDGSVTTNSVPTRLSFVTGTNSSDRAERLTVKSTGNVGIGTTTPTGLLNIASTLPYFYLTDTNGATDNKHWFMENNAGVLSLGTTSDALGVSATRALSITNAGNVGVGITTPGNRFEVKSDSETTGVQEVPGITIHNNSITTDTRTGINFQNYDLMSAAVYTKRSSVSPQLRFATANYLNNGSILNAAGLIDRMVIESNTGYVGIGTTTPEGLLHVTDGIGVYANGFLVDINDGGVTSNRTLKIHRPNQNDVNIQTVITSTGDVSSGSLSLQGAGGNVGIGTTTPNAALDVSSGLIALQVGADSGLTTRTNETNKIFRIGSFHYTNTEEPAAIIQGTSGAGSNTVDFGGGTALMNTATALRFFTASNGTTLTGTERMVINGSGNVGIGTTSPSSKLAILANSTGLGGIYIAGQANGSASLLNISTTTGNATTTVFQIDQNGLMTLNTPGATSTITGNLRVVGGFRADNTYTGDLIFANSFRFTEAAPEAVPQSLILKNQKGDSILNVDENGNLEILGDICSGSVTCFGRRLDTLSDNISALASSTKEHQALTFSDLHARYEELASSTGNSVLDLGNRLEYLEQLSETAASSTATILNSSLSFIQKISAAVLDLIKSAGELAINTLTAVRGVFSHVQSDTIDSKSVQSNSVQTRTLCVGQTCVTESELQALLQNAHVNAVSTTTVSTPVDTVVTTSAPVITTATSSVSVISNQITGTTTAPIDTLTATSSVSENTSVDNGTASSSPVNGETTEGSAGNSGSSNPTTTTVEQSEQNTTGSSGTENLEESSVPQASDETASVNADSSEGQDSGSTSNTTTSSATESQEAGGSTEAEPPVTESQSNSGMEGADFSPEAQQD